MNTVISTGDRLKVVKLAKKAQTITIDTYMATAVAWMPSGRLKIQSDHGPIRIVSADNVKKVADAVQPAKS